MLRAERRAIEAAWRAIETAWRAIRSARIETHVDGFKVLRINLPDLSCFLAKKRLVAAGARLLRGVVQRDDAAARAGTPRPLSSRARRASASRAA
jgi:hypothetical protein